MYKHVVWDWNGTLLDDVYQVYQLFLATLKQCELSPISYEVYRAKFHYPLHEFYAECGVDFSLYPYQQITKDFYTAYQLVEPYCHLFSDVISTLQAINDMGISQSIISAFEHEALQQVVAKRNIMRFFTEVRGVSQGVCNKLIEAKNWLAQKNFSAAEVVWIGDTDHDAEVASYLGVDCILVARGCVSASSLQKLNPLAVLPDFCSLLEVLENNVSSFSLAV